MEKLDKAGATSMFEQDDSGRGSAPFSRAALIIDYVAGTTGGASLKQISEAVGLPASTTHRLVNSLVAIGYLSGNDRDKTYYLGRRLLLTLHTAFGSRKVQAMAEPVLKRLVQRFGLVFYVNQLIAEKVRMVAFVLPERVERALVIPGEYTPINATAAGKAIFAFQEARVIDRQLAGDLPKFQPSTITDPAMVRKELELVRERGYAITNSEFEMGVIAIAVPIELQETGVVFSIGLAGFERQMFDQHTLEAYVAALKKAAKELQVALSITR